MRCMSRDENEELEVSFIGTKQGRFPRSFFGGQNGSESFTFTHILIAQNGENKNTYVTEFFEKDFEGDF